MTTRYRFRLTTPAALECPRFNAVYVPSWQYTRVIIVETVDGDRAWLIAFRLTPLIFWRYLLYVTDDITTDSRMWTGRTRELIGWCWPFMVKFDRREMITGAWNETADAA